MTEHPLITAARTVLLSHRRREDGRDPLLVNLPAATHADLVRAAALGAARSVRHITAFDPKDWSVDTFEHEAWRDLARHGAPSPSVRRLYVVPHRGLATDLLNEQLALDRASGQEARVIFVSSIPDSLRSSVPAEGWAIDDAVAVTLSASIRQADSAGVWHVSSRQADVSRAIAAFDELWQRAETSPSAEELDLEEPLVLSADLLHGVAPVLCEGDHVDPTGCAWYHGTWQYLRLLNLVSTPTWHADFYSRELAQAVAKADRPKILITGTADYSVLAYVIAACKAAGKDASIRVVDLCATPLFACRWYSKRVGFPILVSAESVIADDMSALSEQWDLICTDAFLTRFEGEERDLVISRWAALLAPQGRIVTTVRVHPRTTTVRSTSDAVADFKARAEQRAQRWSAFVDRTAGEIGSLAENYATRMVSHQIGTEDEIVAALKTGGLIPEQLEIAEVPGELYPTAYARLVLALDRSHDDHRS